jgi:hypothetical protein
MSSHRALRFVLAHAVTTVPLVTFAPIDANSTGSEAGRAAGLAHLFK